MDITLKHNTNTVTVSGKLTVNTISEFKNYIDNYLFNTDSLQIKFDNLEEIDTAAIQYIYALKKHREKNNKQTNITGDLPEYTKKLLEKSNMLEVIN
ncbi:MAG: STAS domain-containing protein [Bacteroidales bacterium]